MTGNASQNGWDAEGAAARKYNLDGEDEETGWYDLYAPNGVKYQVKSATYQRRDGSPGRFRFWSEHFERLHNTQSAVILVLTNPGTGRPVMKIEKVSTATVADVIDGRWYSSGHDDMGLQYKIPWSDLLTY